MAAQLGRVLCVALAVMSFSNCMKSPTSGIQALAESLKKTKKPVSGKVRNAGGSALSGAYVAVTEKKTEQKSLTARGLIKSINDHGQYLAASEYTDEEGDVCEDLSSGLDGVLVSDCSDAEGNFSFSEEALPCDSELTVIAKKGSFVLTFSLTITCEEIEEDVIELGTYDFDEDCGFGDDDAVAEDMRSTESDEGDLESSEGDSEELFELSEGSCDFDEARMAVVTGAYDEIENVLAKLGFGSVDATGRLDYGASFDFTIIDGTGNLEDADYTNFDEFIGDLDEMSQYDIIFINCGNAEDTLAQDPTAIANLQEYVENGGKLYVTDWSYAFVENPFPEFINFYLSNEDADQVEEHGHAKRGKPGTYDADVKDAELAAWLDAVTVNNASLKDSCSVADEDLDAREGARNIDGTITVGDFLASWAIIQGEHEGYEGQSKVWLKGVISSYDGVNDLPLTMTKDIGEGRVLYSSYHTAHSCPTTGFWPQERVLEYLIFEM